MAGRRVRPRAFLAGSPGRSEGSLMKLSSVSSSCSNSSESRPGAGSSRCPLFKDHSLMAMSSAVMCTDCANQLLKKVPSMGNEVERPDGGENKSRCVSPFRVAQDNQPTQARHLVLSTPPTKATEERGQTLSLLARVTNPRTGFANCVAEQRGREMVNSLLKG